LPRGTGARKLKAAVRLKKRRATGARRDAAAHQDREKAEIPRGTNDMTECARSKAPVHRPAAGSGRTGTSMSCQSAATRTINCSSGIKQKVKSASANAGTSRKASPHRPAVQARRRATDSIIVSALEYRSSRRLFFSHAYLGVFRRQQFLYFLPLPQGHDSLRPMRGVSRTMG
jgi:hypothetical protein